ncbi:ABC transporter substrate-binding protein [Leifsonia poae]|uniref:ABC transporter substrate-binding protein n=1 Tax=Leifsonia poae TaxID=110933 RepID=A0A9W6H8K1_9MICO|nr:ABC transporter substrate-binding protein [Leifsonia poae]GLJ75874.1 ABC transporter substrate-binding protein [Leifsonia poae]
MTTSPSNRRRAAVVAGALTAALLLAACSPQGSSGGSSGDHPSFTLTSKTAAPSGDIPSFTWAIYAEPFTLDYAHAFDYPDNQVLANVCESLLRLNPDWTLSPSLATSFSHPTPLKWVYEIRDGVTFHDGSPLTAADAVASMRRHLDPEVGSAWFSVYQNVSSITQTGAREVTVTTTRPDSQFNLAMGGSAGVVESAATLAKAGADYGNSTGGVNCTGPFEFTSWKSGESITLTRYPGYWDSTLKAKAGKVTFLFMNDSTSRTNALTSGEVDGSWMIPMDAVDTLSGSSSGGKLYFGLNTAVNSLVVSNLKGPLGDVNVRKALMMALDRQGIVDAAVKGYGTVTDALTTKSVWEGASKDALATAFTGLHAYPYDVKAAKALVEKAGATGKQIVIRTAPIGTDFSVVAQATAAAAQSIGLKAKIETVTPNAYTTLFSDPAARAGADLFYTSWYLSSPDPLEMYSVLRTGDFSNYGDWSDPSFDAVVSDALGIDDPAARSEKSAEAQRIANDQLPWLPLFESPTSVYLGKRITGVQPSVAFLYYPWAATIGAR